MPTVFILLCHQLERVGNGREDGTVSWVAWPKPALNEDIHLFLTGSADSPARVAVSIQLIKRIWVLWLFF